MLTMGTTLLSVANEHSFAVPAFNISDYAMFAGDLGPVRGATGTLDRRHPP